MKNITLEEIIKASKPGGTLKQRRLVKDKIIQSSYDNNNEAIKGAIRFLEDHNYDFDELHQFLKMPLVLNFNRNRVKNKIHSNYFTVSVCIFLISVCVWFYQYKSNTNNLMIKYAIYEPGLPVFASIYGERKFNNLMSSFRLGEISKGLYYFHLLQNKNIKNDTLEYFGGWLYFENKQYDSAAICFNASKVINSVYCNRSIYMEAISLYVNGNKKNSQSILETIANDSTNEYNTKAHLLLKNRSLW